jgi:2-C-methyl-D-erythritol 2,4-cyclodiphosphate synthase
MRIGQGFDVHRLVEGRVLWLGGVEVDYERGLEGHSDGDVLLHAVADAILGALGEGDLGSHFPSSDSRWRGVASREILAEVVRRMADQSMEIEHLDATVIAEAPRLAPYQEKMRAVLSDVLGLQGTTLNLKITSTDGLGAIGAGEGIAAMAVVLLNEKRS